jgi:hypothetical protein
MAAIFDYICMELHFETHSYLEASPSSQYRRSHQCLIRKHLSIVQLAVWSFKFYPNCESTCAPKKHATTKSFHCAVYFPYECFFRSLPRSWLNNETNMCLLAFWGDWYKWLWHTCCKCILMYVCVQTTVRLLQIPPDGLKPRPNIHRGHPTPLWDN